MADVTGNTLLMAVQAVNDAIAVLRHRVRTDSPACRDDTEMLLSYLRTAEELRAAYEIARLTAKNLPPYESLNETSAD